MREIFRKAHQVALAAFLLCSISSPAIAQSTSTNITNQNISGFNLPGVQLPSGTDEVRAADGTTCRSAITSNGAYMDVGIMGNPENSAQHGSFSAYGRVIIPLGHKPKRLDCTRLYDLEIARLEMELKLSQMGFAQGISPVFEEPVTGGGTSSAAEDDWSEAPEKPVKRKVKKASKSTRPTRLVKSHKARKSAQAETTVPAWVSDGWSNDGLSDG